MRLVNMMLLPMIVLSVLSILFGNQWTGVDVTTSELPEALKPLKDYIAWRPGGSAIFNIDALTGAIAILVAIGVVVSLIGIRVLGSGLSETSVKIIGLAIIYTGLWGVLSFLAIPLLFENAIIGSLIYVVLTIGYIIGVFGKISGGE